MPDSYFGGGNYNSGYGNVQTNWNSGGGTSYNGSGGNGGGTMGGGGVNQSTQQGMQPGQKQGQQQGGVNAAAAAAAAMAVAKAAQQAQQQRQQQSQQNRSPLQMQNQMRAVSRGPGMLNNGMPGVQNLNHGQVVNSLAGAFADKTGQVGPQYSKTANDLQRSIPLAARTLGGEVYGLPQNDYTAAANTMQNRMALRQNDIGSKALYGDGTLGGTLKGYDANGLRYASTGGRSGVPQNSAYKATQPGTTEYNKGLLGLADANSMKWRSESPKQVVDATHYYTGAQPKWARGQENTKYGAHKFSTPRDEFTRTQVAQARGNTPQPLGSQIAATAGQPLAPQQGWGDWASNLAQQGNGYLQSGLQQAKAAADQINTLPGDANQQAALIKNATGGGGLLGKALAPVQYAGDTVNSWMKENLSAPDKVKNMASQAGSYIGGVLPGSPGAALGFAPQTAMQVYPGSMGAMLSGAGGQGGGMSNPTGFGGNYGGGGKKKKKKPEDDTDTGGTNTGGVNYPSYYSTWAGLPKGPVLG